jgi:membrane fusion protein (multidrug efflux system)
MKSRIFAIVVLIAGAAGLYWYTSFQDNAAKPSGGWQMPPPTVEVAPVQIGAVRKTVEAVGTLRANESVVIRPEIAGIVKAIHFTEGQRVAKGAPLFSLDDSVYRAEQQEKTANRRIAELAFNRADKLVEKRAASVEERDRALALLQGAEASVQLAQARLEKTRITAPFPGVMGLRTISEGDFVESGQRLVSLVELDPIKVDFRVGEIFLAEVLAGQTIEVGVDALPGKHFVGEVYAIEPQVDINGRAIVIRALLPNPELTLRPGLFSRVQLIINAAAEAILVPEDAIVPRGDQHFVFRIIDGHAIMTEVIVGQRRASVVEIREGLTADDVVVTAGQLKLRDGIAVSIVTDEAEVVSGPAATQQQGT